MVISNKTRYRDSDSWSAIAYNDGPFRINGPDPAIGKREVNNPLKLITVRECILRDNS